jgi:hypothetical protein
MEAMPLNEEHHRLTLTIQRADIVFYNVILSLAETPKAKCANSVKMYLETHVTLVISYYQT